MAVPLFASQAHHVLAGVHGHGHASLKHSTLRHSAGRLRRAVVARIRGQRQIDPARATQIQQALIRENYLTGAPSGQWDATTESAMVKYQSDHGWQTRLTPDSRALIKLGLGPNSAEPGLMVQVNVQTAASEPVEADTLASAHAVRE